MILPCVLNNSIEFLRTCRKSWFVLVALALATFIQDSMTSIALMLNFGKETSGVFKRVLSQLNPFLLVHLYLFSILVVLVLEFAENRDTSLKHAAKVSLKRYPYLLLTSIIVTLLIFFFWMLFGFFTSYLLKSLLENHSIEFSFALVILALIPATYILLRFSLYYCYVIEGEFLRSFKLSWRSTREIWLDIFIIGLISSIVDQLISFPNLFDKVFSTLVFAFLIVILTFMYFKTKKEEGGGCG